MKNGIVYIIDTQSVPGMVKATNDTHTNLIWLERYCVGINRYDIECIDIKSVWNEEIALINRLKRAYELKQNDENDIWLDKYIQTLALQ